MKQYIELDAEDIRKIIAKHFSVEEKAVRIDVVETTEGYGMDEHMAHVVECTVSTSASEQI